MSVSIINSLREVAALGRVQRANLAAGAIPLSAATGPSGQSLAIGQRVIDRLTGLHGTVARTFVQSAGVPTPILKYLVRFDDGTQAGRTVEGLLTEGLPVTHAVASAPVSQFKSLTSGPTLAAEEAALEATLRSVGTETLKQQILSGNPGLPQPGSLEYADFKRRGIL